MSNAQYVHTLRDRLAGRSKRDLIEKMIARTPHTFATEKAIAALEVYPHLLLMLASDYPTKLWILDKGEKPSSAEILSNTVLAKKWHSAGISIDECEGITDVVGNYVAMVVSWKTLLIMRHEFAHALTTFLSPSTRSRLTSLYEDARRRGDFLEPLAVESLGEYAACGFSYYFFADLQEEMKNVDIDLYKLVHSVLGQAESLSALMSSPMA